MSVNQVSVDKNNNNYIRAKRFVNTDDSSLRRAAYYSTFNRHEARKQRKILVNGTALTLGSFIVSNAILAPVKKGHALSGKLGMGIKSVVGVGFALASFIAGADVINTGVKNSSSLQDFVKKHPMMSFLGEFGLLFAGMSACEKGVGKLGKVLVDKFPKSAKSINSAVKTFAEDIDNTVLNNKILKNIDKSLNKFAKKRPNTLGRLVSAVRCMPFMVLGGSIGLAISHDVKKNNEMNKKYFYLKQAQKHVSNEMVNRLEIQNRKLTGAVIKEASVNRQLHRELEVASKTGPTVPTDRSED